jgi:membrane fusion protein (multidrug efflux system)
MSETNLNANKVQRRNKLLGGVAGVVALSAIAAGVYWFTYGSHFVSTDNAYAAVEVAQVTSAVGGTINEVLVTDTQAVKKARSWSGSTLRMRVWHWLRPRLI